MNKNLLKNYLKKIHERRFFLKVGYVVAGLLVIIAILSSTLRLITPWVNHYRTPIENYASQKLGMPVKISKIEAGWYHFHPVIHLSHVQILKANRDSLVEISDIGVGINLFSSLWQWNFQPGILLASNVQVNLDSSIFSDKPFAWKQTVNWILNRTRIELNDVQVKWKGEVAENAIFSKIPRLSLDQKNEVTPNIFKNQSSFILSHGYLILKKKYGNKHHLEIQFDWIDVSSQQENTPSTHFLSVIDFTGKANEELDTFPQWEGHFFVAADNLSFSKWKKRAWPFIADDKKASFSVIQINNKNNHIQWWGDFKEELGAQHLELSAQNFEFDYPAMFSEPLPFSRININLGWEKAHKKWHMGIERLFLENDQISINNQGTLLWENTFAEAWIQLESQFALQDLGKIPHFLPDKVMNNKLKIWLHHSIVAGNRTTGTLLLKGHLKDFPFDGMKEDQGIFLVDSYWNKFTLNFKDEWPAAKEMNAHIIFKNRDLLADIYGGTIDALPLTAVKAKILGMGSDNGNILDIQGHLQSNAANARHFVLNSPLKANLSAFQKMTLSGPAIFDISIQIPLSAGDNNNVVNGKINFLDNEFILKDWWNLHFNHFKGWLTYNQSGIVDSQLKASLLGYPLNLRMKNVQKPKPATVADISGILGINALKKIFNVFVFDFMKGATSYQAKLILTSSSTDQNNLVLHSNLKGITINLPKPFGKSSAQVLSAKSPLSLVLKFSDVSDTSLAIDYANQLGLYLVYGKNKSSYHFKRGGIHLGGKNAEKLSPSTGLKIKGSLPEFSLAAWEPFLQRMARKEPIKKKVKKTDNIVDVMQSIELVIPKIDIKGEIISNANVELYRTTAAWAANIKSDQLAGNIQIANPIANGITANLSYLYLHPSKGAQKNIKSSALRPGDIPPLTIRAQHVQYEKMNLGKVFLVTRANKKNNQMIFKELTVQLPATILALNGTWSSKNISSRKTNKKTSVPRSSSFTSITGYLSSTDIPTTLIHLGIEPVVQGKKGQINFGLNWASSPSAFKISYLNGTADLKLEKGVITHLSKEMESKVGLGKLLSIFSLQNLARRLQLNFSDLSEKGFSFDSLKGNFVLKNGNMTTNNTELKGPIADVNMKGSIDLAKKMYNLVIHIAPQASLAVPVIATIAGGPVVGLAALAANTLINQGMQKTSMYTYKVEGPWKNPKIQSTK